MPDFLLVFEAVVESQPQGFAVHRSTPVPGLSAGAIAGIVIGSVAGVALIAGAIVVLVQRRRRALRAASQVDGRELLGAAVML